VAGVLTNARRGANLVTDATYVISSCTSSSLSQDGNSGVYLRGRYEAQVEDSVVTVGSAEATGGLGAIYGFLMPNQNAAKGAGEWQTYDITWSGRMVTVVLNGREVICRTTIPGITGGALDSNEGAPGPIMLQGDHGPVEYRNLTITRSSLACRDARSYRTLNGARRCLWKREGRRRRGDAGARPDGHGRRSSTPPPTCSRTCPTADASILDRERAADTSGVATIRQHMRDIATHSAPATSPSPSRSTRRSCGPSRHEREARGD